MHGLNGLDAWVVGLMVGAVWLACAQKSRVAASHAKRLLAELPAMVALLVAGFALLLGVFLVSDLLSEGSSRWYPWTLCYPHAVAALFANASQHPITAQRCGGRTGNFRRLGERCRQRPEASTPRPVLPRAGAGAAGGCQP